MIQLICKMLQQNYYVDVNDNLRILKAGDTMSGPLNMNKNFITNLSNPQNSGDAVNKS